MARVAEELAAAPGERSEQTVYAAGGLSVAVRTASAWAASEPGRAAAAQPIVQRRPAATASARGLTLPPAALPAQFLDHGTGYLIAAAVLRALTDRLTAGTGAGCRLRLALATTAAWLLDSIPATDPPPPADHRDHSPRLAEADSPMGRLRYALPPIHYDGSPTTWSRPPGPPAADLPRWRPSESENLRGPGL
ncbi:CoA transferase [Streptomyces sp. NPDC003300]|uniref:CoA transferase n=1 Tax=unclassified Streptomyces TaxID=2593676 RepID=UPI0033A5D2AD